MPQFEVAPAAQEPVMVRAKRAEDAVRHHADAGDAPLVLAEAEPGTGWQAVTLAGEPWGRVRPRDRMRFRRD